MSDQMDRYLRPRGVVYRIFDGTGTLLYVGKSNELRIKKRLQMHASRAPWRRLTHSVEREDHADGRAALHAERDAIHAGRPIFNRQCNGGLAEQRRRERAYRLHAGLMPAAEADES